MKMEKYSQKLSLIVRNREKPSLVPKNSQREPRNYMKFWLGLKGKIGPVLPNFTISPPQQMCKYDWHHLDKIASNMSLI